MGIARLLETGHVNLEVQSNALNGVGSHDRRSHLRKIDAKIDLLDAPAVA